MRVQPLARVALLCATVCHVCSAETNYQVIAIPLIPGSTGVAIGGMNDRGQVVGTFFNGPDGLPVANFLYIPGAGVSNIERTGPPSTENFEGSGVSAINSSGQILLASGLLYSPDRAPQDLAPAVRAAYPNEPTVIFVSLNDSGMVSGTSIHPGDPNGHMQHVFRYTPGSSAGVVTVAFVTSSRVFPKGPFVMDDAQNVIYSVGFPPGGAIVVTASGRTVDTGCPRNTGWANVINNSGQIGGGWGAMTAYPEICTLDPNTFQGQLTTFVDESNIYNGGRILGLNNKGDGVGRALGSAMLFTSGRVVPIDTLFPAGSGWFAQTSDRINDAGEIAGTGTLNGVPAAYVLTPVPATTYSAQSLCTACTGIRLSNSGFAVSRETSSETRFLISSPRGPDTEITNAASIQQINDIGAIAGSDVSGHAFFANPPYNQFYNLNPIFGWSSGAATGINDGNDVIGIGDSASLGATFANLRVSNLYQINNAAQITGSYLDAANRTHFFLYTPRIGIAELANQPIALSNTGDVLVFSASGEYSVVRSDGVLPLPSGFTWRALNDRDEVVGDCNDPAKSDCAVYYSPDRGLIRLMVSGLNLGSAVAINNAGRILANATSPGSSATEAVVLIPGSELTALPRDRSTIRKRVPIRVAPRPAALWAESAVRSLNAIRVSPGMDGAER